MLLRSAEGDPEGPPRRLQIPRGPDPTKGDQKKKDASRERWTKINDVFNTTPLIKKYGFHFVVCIRIPTREINVNRIPN